MIISDIITEISKIRAVRRPDVPTLSVHMNDLAYKAITEDPTQWMPSIKNEMVKNGNILGCVVVREGDTGIMPRWYVMEDGLI